MPLGFARHFPRDLPRCSFCGKSQHEVGKLVSSASAGSSAYICNECIGVCTSIMEQKDDPFTGNPFAEEFFALTEKWITRESQGEDASQELSRMRSMAREMFVPLPALPRDEAPY